VRVLDHIIVGHARQDYFSFARAGMVQETPQNTGAFARWQTRARKAADTVVRREGTLDSF
jgi:hypothetical protein